MTHLYIELNTGLTEEVNSSIISKLYELAISGDLDNTSDLKGRLHSSTAKEKHVTYLNNNFDDLYISADTQSISFDDPDMETYMKRYIGTNEGVSLLDVLTFVASGTNLGDSYVNTHDGVSRSLFITKSERASIDSFNELSLFNGITTLGNYVFTDSNISSITLPSSITTLRELAFSNCTNLTSINLDNIQYLYKSSFYKSGLTGIINLPSIKRIGVNGGMCFMNCSNITEINCGNSLEQFIGSQNFSNCTNLQTVTGLSNITTIPDNTFEYCNNLSSIDIDWSKITSIGSRCFSETGITSVTIGGNDILTLPYLAFYGCTNLTTAVLPNVTSLGLGVFGECSNLTTVDLSNVVTVGNLAFAGCTSLTSLSLPKCTTISDEMAFTFSGIVSISLPLCTSIGRSAFHLATHLTSVSIPSCTYIGPVAFDHCLSLTSITLPEGLLTIGDYAFTASAFAGYFEIPSTVTSIGKELFRDSPNITGYVFKGTTPPTLSNGLGKMFGTHLNGNLVRPIYVPDASVSAYLTTFADNPDYVAAIKPMSQKPS